MSDILDTAPSISVAIEYGKYVKDFDVDIEGMTKYLQSRGLSDEQISNLRVDFTDTDEVNDGIRDFGEYNRKADKIDISHLSDLQEASQKGSYVATRVRTELLNRTLIHELEHKIAFHDRLTEQERVRYLRKLSIKKFSLPFVAAIASGLGSAYEPHVSEVLSRPDFHGMQPLRGLGMLAITGVTFSVGMRRAHKRGVSHEEYEAEPEESRAREAEEIYQHRFVSFTPVYDESIVDNV